MKLLSPLRYVIGKSPMLAYQKNPCLDTQVRYPTDATPKIDGIRFRTLPPVRKGAKCALVSRTNKPIPNRHIRKWCEKRLTPGLDGELAIPCATFSENTHAIMKRENPESAFIRVYVFDYLRSSLSRGYSRRMKDLKRLKLPARCIKLLPTRCKNADDVRRFHAHNLKEGWEGTMLRDPEGPYKARSRATLKEGWLLKLKDFLDSEAEIIGYEELFHNDNEATRDILGRLERSSAKAGKRAGGVLGFLIVRDIKTKVEFKIGSGFTAADRVQLWKVRTKLPGKIIKYKFQPHGVKEKPRFPRYLGFRHKRDML